VSPDDKWIAFSTSAPQEDIFVIHPDGTGQRQLTSGGAKNRVPRWSPDGSVIAFYSDRGGTFQGWTIRPDGSDLELLSTEFLFNLVWSPDGKHLACNAGPHQDLCLLDLTRPLSERRPSPLPRPAQPLFPLSWSRDGERLLAVADVEPGVFMYSFGTRRYERLTKGAARWPFWVPDSRSLLYVSGGKIISLDTGSHASRELYATPAYSELREACPNHDGSAIYTVRSMQARDIWLGAFP
jgi:Tol biopolymer transport system component